MSHITTVIIADDDSLFLKELSSAINQNDSFEIIGEYQSGVGLADDIIRLHPDALVLDLMLSGENALSILQKIHEAPLPHPTIFILSSFASPQTTAECDRLDASFFLRKPVHVEALTDLLSRYSQSYDTSAVVQPLHTHLSEHDLTRYINRLLDAYHVPSHVLGYRYLRTAILLAVHNESMSDYMTKRLYPAVAKQYHTTWNNVERNIRNAVQLAWERSQGSFAGFNAKRHPANREFIFTLADRIRFELHMEEHCC